MVIAHNLLSMNAQRQYGIVTDRRAKTAEKLSSGYKVNRAADDAAGLQISEKMRTQIRGLNQGSDNIQNGISLVQIADGALAEVNDMLHRMTELSVKSANGTNTSQDRQAIQHEIAHLVSEIDKISKTTEYNTMPIFDDMYGEDVEGKVTNLVASPAAVSGHMTEAYNDGSHWYPAATIDFSNINSRNLSKLNNQGFSFNCSQSCDEAFNITFKTDGTPSSAKKLSGKGTHEYTVDLRGCKSGKDVVDRIFSYVTSNPPNGYSSPLVSHSNGLAKNGSSIIVYSTTSVSSEAAAKSKFANSKSKYGGVDCSDLAGLTEDGINNVWIQCSSVPGDGLNMEIPRINSTVLGIKGLDISTQGGAQKSIALIDNAGLKVSSIRSSLGAYQNRLEHSYDNNMNKAENTQAAESRIRDTDMADEMVRFAKDNILEQVGNSIMAQANQSTQGVLSLIGA